jgi:hypothetical protein
MLPGRAKASKKISMLHSVPEALEEKSRERFERGFAAQFAGLKRGLRL